jgi:hypothetical protein
MISLFIISQARGPAASGSSEDWLTLLAGDADGSRPRVYVAESSLNRISLDMELPGVFVQGVTEGNQQFDAVRLPGYGHTYDTGRPELPVIREGVALPVFKGVTLQVSVHDSVVLEGYNVVPVSDVVFWQDEEGLYYSEEVFAIDSEFYASDVSYPTEIARLSHTGSIRGQGAGVIEVFPFRFNPSSNELVAYTSLTVDLVFQSPETSTNGPGPMDAICEEVLLNYGGIGKIGSWSEYAKSVPGTTAWCNTLLDCKNLGTDYLIVVDDNALYDGYGWVDSLAEHRVSFNSFNVAKIAVGDICTGYPNDTELKDFIKALYDDGSAVHMIDGYLGYVLLVGDALSTNPNYGIPAHEDGSWTNDVTTDHWYACVEGGDDDYFADLLIGRIAASDTSELRAAVQKVIGYEPVPDSSWANDVFLSCGPAPGDSLIAKVHATFDTIKQMIPEGEFDISEIHRHVIGKQAAIDSNQANIARGKWLIVYGGHGFETGWQTLNAGVFPGIARNFDNLPIVVAPSCRTGAFDWADTNGNQDCFAETFLEADTTGGAVAYLGASEVTYGYAFNGFCEFLHEGLFEHHQYVLGSPIAFAKMKDLATSGTTENSNKFNLIGDPAINTMLRGGDNYTTNPDLTIRAQDVSSAPRPICFDSGTVTVQAAIRNESNVDVDPVIVEFVIDASSTATLRDTLAVDAWTDSPTEVGWTPSQNDVGDITVTVTIDPDGAIDELFEDNNEVVVDEYVYFYEPGFPLRLSTSGELRASPTLADLDFDGKVDILIGSTADTIYRVEDGTVVRTFDSGDPIYESAAVGDLDFDGHLEVMFCSGDTAYALNDDLERFDKAEAKEVASSIVLADFDGADGKLEWGVVTYPRSVPFRCYRMDVYSNAFSLNWGHSIGNSSGIDGSGPPRSSAAVADVDVGDIDNDGSWEIVIASGSLLGAPQSTLYAFEASKNVATRVLWSTPLGDTDGKKSCLCSPALADLNGDGRIEIATGSDSLYIVNGDDGTRFWKYDTWGDVKGVCVSDVDDDGKHEVIAVTAGNPSSTHSWRGHMYVFDIDSDDGSLKCDDSVQVTIRTAPTISDLDGDGNKEVIFAGDRPGWIGSQYVPEGRLYILEICGNQITELVDPVLVNSELWSTPAALDIDDDGKIEIVFGDKDGFLHALQYFSTGSDVPDWPMLRRDERNTALREQPVEGAVSDTVSWWGDLRMFGDVTIDGGAVLRVEPGSRITAIAECDSQVSGVDTLRAELIVDSYGLLLADGTNDSIEFHASSDTANAWYGIRFKPGSRGHLRSCSIRNSYKAIDADSIASLSVRSCDIDNPMSTGIYVEEMGDSVVIVDNTIAGGNAGINIRYCDARVDSNWIHNVIYYGIKVRRDSGSVVRANCVTVGDDYGQCAEAPDSVNGYLTGIFINRSESGPLRVADNRIRGAQNGMYCHLNDSPGDSIVRNKIAVGDGGVHMGINFYDADPTVRRNRIKGMIVGFGVYESSDPTISDSNYVWDKPEYGYWVYDNNGSETPINAENNWWGGSCCWGEPQGHPPVQPLICTMDTAFYGQVDFEPLIEDTSDFYGPCSSKRPALAKQSWSYELSENWPNPFNPDTRITYSIAAEGHVEMNVFNLRGQLVRTLVDERQKAGKYEVSWNGRDGSGLSVASGVYFLKMESGEFGETKKLIVIK